MIQPYVVLEDSAGAQDESQRDRLDTSTWLCAEDVIMDVDS
jgi:hypothetical protein